MRNVWFSIDRLLLPGTIVAAVLLFAVLLVCLITGRIRSRPLKCLAVLLLVLLALYFLLLLWLAVEAGRDHR